MYIESDIPLGNTGDKGSWNLETFIYSDIDTLGLFSIDFIANKEYLRCNASSIETCALLELRNAAI